MKPGPKKGANLADYTGDVHGMLTIVGRDMEDPAFVLCICECGTHIRTRIGNLRAHKPVPYSCGCVNPRTGAPRESHGMTDTPEYRAWEGIKYRCLVPTSSAYQWYGGRGIRICSEWENSFTAFYSYVGPRPSPDHSIDRKDNDGNYEPGNVRWATRDEQLENTRDWWVKRGTTFTREGERGSLLTKPTPKR